MPQQYQGSSKLNTIEQEILKESRNKLRPAMEHEITTMYEKE